MRYVLIALGRGGALLATPEGEHLISAPEVEPVDTTAAGDAFNGALAFAVGSEMRLEDAVAFANCAGALAVTREGAQPSLPWREGIEGLLP